MSESLTEVIREYKSGLFIDYYNGLEGESGFALRPDEIDWSLSREDWPNQQSMIRVADRRCPSLAISSYGYSVYKDWNEEENPPKELFLDARVFANETELIDVLAEAAWCAIDEGQAERAIPFIEGVLHYADMQNFSGAVARKYLELALASNNYSSVRAYVDFINARTVKGPDDSKEFLRRMAHGIQALNDKGLLTTSEGLDTTQKQILLEDIGHAWIRKSMPIAEIDWLP